MNSMFRAIDVWKRLDDSRAVRYRCFQSLQTGKYSVQSADYYQLPPDSNHVKYLDRQSVELFIERSPDERAGTHETLETAIEADEALFGK